MPSLHIGYTVSDACMHVWVVMDKRSVHCLQGWIQDFAKEGNKFSVTTNDFSIDVLCTSIHPVVRLLLIPLDSEILEETIYSSRKWG